MQDELALHAHFLDDRPPDSELDHAIARYPLSLDYLEYLAVRFLHAEHATLKTFPLALSLHEVRSQEVQGTRQGFRRLC